MKIAIYIDEGLEQIVLTPESTFERDLLKKLHDGSRELSVKTGGFYACQGGWTRHTSLGEVYNQRGFDEQSTMIVLRPKAPKSPETHHLLSELPDDPKIVVDTH